jgi:hypothetical protein
VQASDVVIINGVEVGGELIVPDGALVEVLGRGRRELSSKSNAGYREAVTDLQLSGSPDEPLYLRVVEPAPAPTPGVRVRVEASVLTAPGHDERERESEEAGVVEREAELR